MIDEKPAQFQDLTGRTWMLELDFVKLRRLKLELGIDLGDLEALGIAWGKLLTDDDRALSVIWLVIAESAGSLGEEDWLRQMDGPTLKAAIDALLVALVNFTLPEKRAKLIPVAKLNTKYWEIVNQGAETLDRMTDKAIERAVAQLGMQPPRSPASSATSTINGT